MSTTKYVPEIRFEKYKAEWVKSDLGELIGVGSAARVHKEQWTKHGVPFYRTSDVVSIYKDQANAQAFISYELYEQLTNKIGKIQRGDLLITGGGSIGIPFLVKNDAPLYFKDADLLWLKNNNKMDGHFLYTFFASRPFRNYLKSISHIGTIGHYTISQAKTTPISYCEREEQGDLGNYFQKLDTLINQHQQKHDKLSNLKKSMQEKMFPKAGETVPEIRFDGFSGDWVEKSLEEIGYFTSGVGFSEKEQGGKSGIPFYKVSDMNLDGNYYHMNKANNYVDEKQIARLKYKPIRETAILFAKVGAAIFLERKRIANNFLMDNNMMAYIPDEDITFMKQWFDKTKLSGYTKVGALPSFNSSDLGEIRVRVPSYDEQVSIGKYLDSLDKLINQYKQQITKLKNIKQACLDKMFV